MQASDSESIFGHDNQFTVGGAVNYASTSFYTGAQIGLINSQLIVLPSNLIVYTPENPNAAIANGASSMTSSPTSAPARSSCRAISKATMPPMDQPASR